MGTVPHAPCGLMPRIIAYSATTPPPLESLIRPAQAKTELMPESCRMCPYVDFCHGDCPRSRQRLCAGWKRFFAHALPRLRELAESCRRG